MNPFYPDDKEDEARLAAFAQGCSTPSLESLFLKRLDYDQKLKKEIDALIEKRVTNLLIVRWAQFLRDHPEARLPQAVEGAHEPPSHSEIPLPPMRVRDGSRRRSERRSGPTTG